jgi:hypothetical protein
VDWERTATNKKCTTCDETDSGRFYADSKGKDGKSSQCKSCLKRAQDARRTTPEGKQRIRDWNARPEVKVRRRKYVLKLMYKLTPERYAEILELQKGNCAFCGLPFNDETPVVDHDHACCPGEKSCGHCVRGLLHSNCNTIAGFIDDNPSALKLGALYLAKAADKLRAIKSSNED